MTHCRPAHSTMRKNQRTITVKRHQEDKQSKATRSLFPIKTYSNFFDTKTFYRQQNCCLNKGVMDYSDTIVNMMITSKRMKLTFNLCEK